MYTEYTHLISNLSAVEELFKRKEFHGLDLVRIATLDYESFGMKKKYEPLTAETSHWTISEI